MNFKITNGSISYGAETIIEQINFTINDRDKIAIVGRNGAGKTTLLKSIVNNEMLEAGTGEEKFSITNQGTPVIGYLKQIEFEDPNSTLLEEILKSYKDIRELEYRIKKMENELQNSNDEDLIKKYTNALDEFKIKDGYTYKKEYETAIAKFGFTKEEQSKKINEFSGGQRTRIALLKLILSKPDILLLDEPTNHIDINTVEWLEQYLKTYPKAIVIVSHDRMFVNKIVNKIYEIEYGEITEYSGDYEAFEKMKKINYERQLADFEFQQKEIKRLKAIADRFKYKPTKAKMALSKLKQIERMDIVDKPNRYDLKTFHTNFNISVESGNLVLSVKNMEIGYKKEQSLGIANFEVYKGQKLAIIGANGKGKSTLLKTLMGYENALSGEFEYGYHVTKDYFDQQMEFLNPENSVYDEISNAFPKLTQTEVRSMLGTFLFSGEDVFKNVKDLSGGEKVRLALCKILKNGANLLLLDEPTNHMDIVGKESLENMLKEYKGTLIFVSHDRYFINKLADSLLVFEDNQIKYYNKTYAEYEEYIEKNKENAIDVKETVNKEKDSDSKLAYLESKENKRKKAKAERLEKEIEKKEQELELLKQEMQKDENSSDYVKLAELQEKIDKINQEIDYKLEEWQSLIE